MKKLVNTSWKATDVNIETFFHSDKMSPKSSRSQWSVNAVLPRKVVPNRVVRYFVQHDFKGKNECANQRNKPFSSRITGIVLLDLWQPHGIGLYFSRSLSLLVISDWIECSALPVHTHTLLNMICILISQMKLQLMKRIDTDGRGFEGSPTLESRHGGFAFCKSSLLPSQAGLLFVPSPVNTQTAQVMMNILLKSRCTGKSLHPILTIN